MTPWGAPTLAEIKAAIRVDFVDDDLLLEGYRLAAIRLIEEMAGAPDWTGMPNLKTAVILIVARWYDAGAEAEMPPLAEALVAISRKGWVGA